jgi:hypothetical protein
VIQQQAFLLRFCLEKNNLSFIKFEIHNKHNFTQNDKHPGELSTSRQSIPQYSEVPPHVEAKRAITYFYVVLSPSPNRLFLNNK